MKYFIQNNGEGLVMIKVIVPETLALPFLAFFDQKNRQNVPIIKSVQCSDGEKLQMEIHQKIYDFFDTSLSSGMSTNEALSDSLKRLKATGYVNLTYDLVKSILSKSGRLRTKKSE